MTTTIPPRWRAGWAERWRSGPGLPSLIFGVLLPLGTLGFELATSLCAEELFDPLPTLLHAVLVALVPACNLFVWMSFSRTHTHPRLLAFANGLAIAVAALYSVLFLPLLPVAAVAIVYFGLGLLPWSPVLALIAALCLRAHLKREATDEQRKFATWPGFLCGALALIAADLPYTLTTAGMSLATSASPKEQARGIWLLRAVGNEDSMLRFCYFRTGRATDLLSALLGRRNVMPEQARVVYYRVTGDVFNAKPEPKNLRERRWMNWDTEQVSLTVGGRLEGLSLASSRLDGSVDAKAALAYLEWTLVLKNDTNAQSEARARVALPPGAVVTRLTLWVNGEEREAAFAGRGEVTAAYQSVVARRRDPVLVTTAGADRIAVQMFPVPPYGEMKARIGMTVPLQLDSLQQGTLQLPYFHERNFELAESLKHSVWVEAKSPLNAGSRRATLAPEGAYALQFNLADSELTQTNAVITVPRDPSKNAWSYDSLTKDHVIKQALEVVPTVAPARLTVVIDSSASMAAFAQPLAEALSHLPPQVELFVIFADDLADTAIVPMTPQDATASVRSHEFIGGEDNTAALAQALDQVLTTQNSALVWVHGPQPVVLQTTASIEQRLERRGQVRWYDVQVMPGANLIAERLDGLANIRTLPLARLTTLFASWRPGGTEIFVHRNWIPSAQAAGPASEQTSEHLARLWADDEVKRLLYVDRDPRGSIIEFAHEYQLVTPVTGAVVLETQQQYEAAGLTPVAEGTVPSIPEPEEWALMIIAALVLLYAWKRRPVAKRHGI
ncbi:VIT domain-containing protein [Steroidobacter flavus]|uniref:VIT domain-containing protein n=1 Tax=Steroidobacter flavus TaxID=1842136 RepID=A0ABV8SZI8_9GAMM